MGSQGTNACSHGFRIGSDQEAYLAVVFAKSFHPRSSGGGSAFEEAIVAAVERQFRAIGTSSATLQLVVNLEDCEVDDIDYKRIGQSNHNIIAPPFFNFYYFISSELNTSGSIILPFFSKNIVL